MYDLQLNISLNWEGMTEIIYNRPTTVSPEKWGGTMIQSNRYEIHLNFGDEGVNLCWKEICNKYGYKESNMKRILKFAAGKTKADMGEEMFATGSISTPALILCKSTTAQTFHLDLMGSNRKQYGMVLSPGATTTTICQPVTTDTCKYMSTVLEILEKGAQSKMCSGIWLHPSKDLQCLIKELDNCSSSTGALAVKEGYGELFRIHRKDQMEEKTI